MWRDISTYLFFNIEYKKSFIQHMCYPISVNNITIYNKQDQQKYA